MRRLICVLMLLTLTRVGWAESGAESRAKSGCVRLLFGGDMNLDCNPGKAIESELDPFEDCAEVFQSVDLSIANLECCICRHGERHPKRWTFQAHPRCVPLLQKYFFAVSVANNHALDYGPVGFTEQLALLKGKVAVFGGGLNATAAHTPLIIERAGFKIALLGYDEFKPREFEATATKPGLAWSVDEQVVADIKRARQQYGAQVVIPMMHWGSEHEPGPNARQQQLAHLMIESGASAVIGGHPHVTQGAEVYHGCPIVYSLGNFVFDGFNQPEAQRGWLARLTLDHQGVLAWDTVTVQMNGEGIPHPQLEVASPAGSREQPFVTYQAPADAAK